MNDPGSIWNRLVSEARRAQPPEPVEEAPLGFSSRVARQWLAASEDAGAAGWLALASRGLACACVLMVLSAALHWRVVWDRGTPEVMVSDAIVFSIMPR